MVRLEESINNLAVEHNRSNYDIWSESGRSVAEQQDFKKRLFSFYKRKGYLRDARCMVTNQWHPTRIIIASHIWKSCTHGDGLHKFGLERKDCFSPRNGFLVLEDIKKRFDVKHLCFLYNPLTQKFAVKIMNPSINALVIEHSEPQLTFRDIDGMHLHHPEEKIPYRRLLSFHARCSFRNAREENWITAEEESAFVPYHNLSETASVPDIASDIH